MCEDFKIGEKIAKLRAEKGMTQYDLADLVQISQPSIFLFESGKRIPTIPRLQAIAKALNVPITYFFE